MRTWVFLECSQCGERFYRTSKNERQREKLELKKFCRSCRAHTVHEETS